MPVAVMLHETGNPDVLQAEEVLVAPPDAGEVQIRQTVAGVNFVDIYFRSGLYPLPSMPAVIGFEGAGQVVAVGSGVSDLRPGDRSPMRAPRSGPTPKCVIFPKRV